MSRKCINPKHVGTPTDTGFSTDWCRLCGGVRLIKPVAVVEIDEPAEDDEQRLGWRQW